MSVAAIRTLSQCGEDEFEKTIDEMPLKGLMETISFFQKEMATEQENFNSLTGELQSIKDRNCRQYKQISKEMMMSQTRLTLFMNRSMKCFAQQNIQHGKQGVELRRRGSLKSLQTTAVVKPTTPVHRSKSMHITQSPSDPSPPQATISSAQGRVPANSSANTSKNPKSSSVVTINGFPANTPASHNHASRPNTACSGDNVSKTGALNTNQPELSNLPSVKKLLGAFQKSTPMSNGVNSVLPNKVTLRTNYIKRNENRNSFPLMSSDVSNSNNKARPANVPPVGVQEQKQKISTTLNIKPSVGRHWNQSGSVVSSRPRSDSLKTATSPFVSNKPVSSFSNVTIISKAKSVSNLADPSLTNNAESASAPSNSIHQCSPASSMTSNNSRSAVDSNSGSTISHSKPGTSVTSSRPGSTITGSNSGSTVSHSKPGTSVTGSRPGSTITGSNSGSTVSHSKPGTSVTGSRPGSAITGSNSGSTVSHSKPGTSVTGSKSGSAITGSNSGSTVTSNSARYVTSKTASGPLKVNSVNSGPNKETNKNLTVNGAVSLKAQSSKNGNSNKMQPSSGKVDKDALLKQIESRRKPEEEESVAEQEDMDRREETFKTTMSLIPSSAGERPRSDSGGSGTSAASLSGSTSDSDSQTNGTTEISTATLAVNAERPVGNQNRPEKPRRISPPKCVQDSEDKTTTTPTSDQTAVSDASATAPSVKDITSSLDQAPVHPMTSAGNVKAKSDPSVRIILEDDDEITPTMNLRPWNPCHVLRELFRVKLMEDTTEDISDQFVCMEGFMEKLPMNKKKATLLKTWKRRFFKATDGWLYYYETSDRNKPSDTIQLMGGNIQDLGNRILGIDDGRGRFLMVRCPTEREHGQWKLALETQTADNTKARYIHPVLKSPPHPKKKVVVIDLGSNAIRAGILGQRPALPQLFFPSVVAVHHTSGKMVVGMDAYFPGIRHESKLFHPISASNKIDKFNIDEGQMPAVFNKVFHDLEINPVEYLVMLSTPMDLSDNLRKGLMTILVDGFRVAGVCMVQQALLSLYSYNTTSGIIVDVGETIEILPIYDGFVIEGGVSMLPYGAEKIEDSLQMSLMTENYRFTSRIERLLVKYIMEQSCYVASDYKAALQECKTNSDTMLHTVQFEPFDLPAGAYPLVKHDISRFKSPEGLFDMDMWEMDFPNLHKLVFQAIQTCPMDSRRHMYRSVYLSGGVTMLQGFRERLQSELVRLAPPNVPIEVHAAPQRYHAAYVGACSVAGMDIFGDMCISREVWCSEGVKSFKKWKAPKG